MALTDRLRDAALALMGVSAYAPAGPGNGPALSDAAVETSRKANGGNISPLPTTRLRWYLANLEDAQVSADAGYLRMPAQLYRAMRRDGHFAGLLGTRTAGLVRLPKRFHGHREAAEILRAKNGTRSVFDEMFPPSELALLAADGIVLGIGIAEMVPVKGRSYPVMVRLEPEFLQYRWVENRWYFNSIAGSIPINPGDGRWILHVPGGRLTPWTSGLWPALGRSFINKEHALLHRSNYSAKLANPARVAQHPLGSSEGERQNFFKRVMAWGVNTVFSLPPGWKVSLLESNGRGYEVFQSEIDTSDNEMTIAVNGQVMTTTGGSGFANGDVGANVRQDLIQDTGEALAYTINTQGIPQFIAAHWGEEALAPGQPMTCVEWDTKTPTDLAKDASTLKVFGDAILAANAGLATEGFAVDVLELATRYGVPLRLLPVTEVVSALGTQGDTGNDTASHSH